MDSDHLHLAATYTAGVGTNNVVSGVSFDGVGMLEASVLHAPEALRIALVSSPDEAV